MNEFEILHTIERYNKRLAEYGPTEKALGWGEKNRSGIRFEILLSRWNLSGTTILDLGCGFGDLYGYLQAKEINNFNYTGIDINPSLISIAQNRYPDAKFLVANILAEPFNHTFDYVLTSGLFNYRLENSPGFVQEMFDRFHQISDRGFAANFLSDKVQFELENTFHADPCKILDIAYGYSNNILLRNDYMPYEFTIFVDKASKVNPLLTVYEEFVKYQLNPPPSHKLT